jgi:hypothetical protein
MNSLKSLMTNGKRWLLGEKGLALGMGVTGAFFLALGIHGFWMRPGHCRGADLLGCVAGAFGAFFLLLVADYVLHHARLVFIPWLVFLIYFAFVQPHFAVGLGLALGFIVVSQMRS